MEVKVKKLEVLTLRKAARELNEMLLAPDSLISLTAGEAELREKIAEASMLMREDDDISEDTLSVVQQVVREREEKKGEEKEEEKEEGEKKEKEEGAAEALDRATKLSELKNVVMEHEEFAQLRKKLGDFSGLQGPKLLKAEMTKLLVKAGLMVKPKLLPKETESKKVSEGKKVGHRVDGEPSKRMTRQETIFRAIRELGSKGVDAEILENTSSKMLSEASGKPAGRADQECRLVLAALCEFGVMESCEDGRFRFVKRAE